MSSPTMPSTTSNPSGPPAFDLRYLYFHYHPSAAAAIVAFVVFFLIDLFIISRIVFKKAPSFMIKLIPLATVEMIGFILRIVCIYTPANLPKFLVMQIFTLVAPNIMSLMNYNTVAEIITLSDIQSPKPHLNPKKITIFFIVCTVLSSIMQGLGGAFQSVADLRNIGLRLALAGLSIQLCVYVLFSVLLAYVYRKKSINYEVEGVNNPKKSALMRVFVALPLLTIRVIYRLAQFSTGPTGAISSREWVMYVFDTLIVAICFLIYGTLYKCFPKRGTATMEEQRDEEAKEHQTDGSFSSSQIINSEKL